MFDSVRPHRRQPTRLPHPWFSPGKNTGLGCLFLLRGIFLTQGSKASSPALAEDSSPLNPPEVHHCCSVSLQTTLTVLKARGTSCPVINDSVFIKHGAWFACVSLFSCKCFLDLLFSNVLGTKFGPLLSSFTVGHPSVCRSEA